MQFMVYETASKWCTTASLVAHPWGAWTWERESLWREKTDKEKSHKGIWRSGCPGGVPGTNSGRPTNTWDIWAWFVCKSILKGQNVPGTDGTHHGTDGTCPRTDGTHTRGCPAKILYVYWLFSFPSLGAKSLQKRRVAKVRKKSRKGSEKRKKKKQQKKSRKGSEKRKTKKEHVRWETEKILCPKDPQFYTPLALNCQKGQCLPAPVVFRNQSPMFRLFDSLDRFWDFCRTFGTRPPETISRLSCTVKISAFI